jgi:hypothetical protein
MEREIAHQKSAALYQDYASLSQENQKVIDKALKSLKGERNAN